MCCDIFIPYYISALCKADAACSQMMLAKLTGIDGMTLQLVHQWKIAPWFHTETCFSDVFLSLIVHQGINSGPWHGRLPPSSMTGFLLMCFQKSNVASYIQSNLYIFYTTHYIIQIAPYNSQGTIYVYII